MSLALPGSGINITLTGTDEGVDALLARIKKRADTVDEAMGRIDKKIVDHAMGVKGLDTASERARGSIGSMFSQFLGANLAMAAIGKLQQGVMSLFGQLQGAMAFQTQSMSLAGDLGTNIGIGFAEANKSVLDIQREIAKEAAALPGVTKQYNDVFNALGSSVAKVFPHDLPRFKEAVMDVTKRVGMLAAVKGVDASEAGVSINRAISGTTGLGELFHMSIFERAPQFVQAMRAELAKAGLTTQDWMTKTNDQMRLRMVRNALKIATPDSLIGEFNDTVESLWQGIQTQINDPLIGMFGFLREIPSLNNTTVMDAVKDFLQAFVRLTSRFGEFVKDMGLSFDPLAPIAKFIHWVATVEYAIAAAFEYRTFDLGRMFDIGGLVSGLAKWLNSAISGLFNMADKISVGGILGALEQIAHTFLIGFEKNYVDKVDWLRLGAALGEFIGKLAVGLVVYTPRLIWLAVTLLGSGLMGLMKLLVGAIYGLIDGAILAPLREVLEAFTRPVVDFFTWMGDGIKSLWDKVLGLIEQAKGVLGIPGQAIQAVVQSGANIGTNLVDAGKSAVTSLWNKITGKPDDPTAKAATSVSNALSQGNVTTQGKLPQIAAPGGMMSAPPSIGGTGLAPNLPGGVPAMGAAPKTVSVLPGAPKGLDESSTPLPSVQNQVAYAGNTFAPTINVPVNNAVDTNTLINHITSHLERQYNDFKRQRLAHGVA